MERIEGNHRQSLCADVCKILFFWHVKYSQVPALDLFSNKMVVHTNVLCFVRYFCIVGDVNCALVVAHYCCRYVAANS
jgi:hypothetical protein